MALDDGEIVLSPKDWVREHTEKILASGTTESVEFKGRPVVLLTIRGRTSGKLHKVPLMRVEHDGRYAAIASKGGAPEHPAWYRNITAEPRVELQDGARNSAYAAREVTGEERTEWWGRAVAAYPPYADYQEKTDRQIPVLVLEPRAE